MDEIARQLGWWVILIGAIYAVGKLLSALGDANDREKNRLLHMYDIVRRLSYRKAFHATTDPLIQAEIKQHYPGWFLLYLELNDEHYRKKLTDEGSSNEFHAALQYIQEKGEQCRLVDGKLLYRPTDGWPPTDA